MLLGVAKLTVFGGLMVLFRSFYEKKLWLEIIKIN
jgi:hypothetical protein